MSESDSPSAANRASLPHSYIDRIGAVTGIIASLSVLVSFVYDWGFFSELEVSFLDAPTTIADHVRSWLLWLPSVAIAAFVILAIELFLLRVEGGMTEKELVESSPNPVLIRRIRNSPGRALAILGPSLVLLWLLLGDHFEDGLGVGLALFWFVFSAWVFTHPVISERYSPLAKRAAFWIPSAVIMIFFFGATVARFGFEDVSASHRLHVTHAQDGRTSQDIRLLRTFQDWLLIRNDKNEVVWISLDGVRKIQILEERRAFRGLICFLWDRWCPKKLYGS